MVVQIFLISERFKKNQNERLLAKIYFWRNHAQQEIDFIEKKDGKINAFEFKWNPKVKAKFPSSFIESYTPEKIMVIS